MDGAGNVNNNINSNNAIIPFSYINHVDRIQLSVQNRYNAYRVLKVLFSNEFGKPKILKTKPGRYVAEYLYGGKLIQLVYYNGKQFFSVIIHDPDNTIQSLIRDMLLSLNESIGEPIAYISQIEFAWDFYPDDPAKFVRLCEVVNQAIYLRHSRVGSYSQAETTCYQGKEGDVRKGTKGLRCYPKNGSNGDFLRVELQANHYLIKRKLKLDICSLPVDPSMVRFSDYFEFHMGYEGKELFLFARDLDNKINKKRKVNNSKPLNPRSLAPVVRQMYLVRRLSGQWNHFGSAVPVAQQISGYRAVKKEHHLAYQPNHFFPKIMVVRMRTNGPRRGYARVSHSLLFL